jgi:uncharacterized protein (TIGR03435 family)
MKGKLALIAGLFVLLLVAIAAKILFFPSIKDAYFAITVHGLQGVPGGLLVLRPTHYPFLKHADPMCIATSESETNFWIMGRNSPLRDLIAVAYREDPSRVALPLDAPKGNFDFLVTLNHGSREQLQAAIRRKLNCRAHVELAETEVLALKVLNPGLPGLKVSAPDAKQGVSQDSVKYHFTHLPVEVVAEWLKGIVNITARDETGLTNFYDYALPVTVKAAHLESDDARRANAIEILKELGLGLEPETKVEEVLVVKTGPPPAPILVERKQTLLGPLNPGAEEGSEHWYHGMNGDGVMLIDHTDAASGESDFAVENSSTNGDNAEWRCETFSLGPATNGIRPLTFSFDYKLPRPVNDGDNMRVQLRFFDQNTNFIDQKIFWLGTRSHDSAMTTYKTVTTDNIQPPAGARLCDITLSANLYDDRWSSGVGRFDNILVTMSAK